MSAPKYSMLACYEYIRAAMDKGATAEDVPRLRREFFKSMGIQVQEELPLEGPPAEPAKRPEIYKGPKNPGRRKDYYWERF